MVVIAQRRARHPEVAQLLAEPVAEYGQQHLAAVLGPVDVEPARVRRGRAVPQHLPQRAVEPFGGGERHVIRHDVEDQAEPVRVRGTGQRAQPVLAAQLRPYRPVVHHVVAVCGAGHGLQDGGEVQVGDAEGGEVGDGPFGGGERELRLELEPVGGGGRCGGVGPHGNVRTRAEALRRFA